MTSTKYIGLDVHKESISIAALNFAGKVVIECVISGFTYRALEPNRVNSIRNEVHTYAIVG